jgi:L-alanine-DL-glutamate epimerase-like enolase superfamily enzyme
MKITSVEIWETEPKLHPPSKPIIIRINTDEGISGLGEVGLGYGVGRSGGAGYVKNLAEAFLIGADPMRTEKLWETMFRSTFWALGGGPVVYGGMSAIDIACWDIRGKALGQPVYQLLGGKTNESLRTYASQLQFGWGEDAAKLTSVEEYARVASQAVGDGYDAVKLNPVMFDEEGRSINLHRILDRRTLKMARDRVAATREAVGDDVDVIIELHSMTSATSAIQLGRIFEEFDCMYFEEGVHYLSVDLQEKVSRNVRIPMAAGERLYTRWGFRPYLEKQVLDVIQPDVCLAGGITEVKKICDYANTYDVTVQLHVCGSPVSKAATLQLEAVIPNFQIHEHHTVALKKANRELCIHDYQPVKGQYAVPDLPGLGQELNEKVMAQFPCVVVK